MRNAVRVARHTVAPAAVIGTDEIGVRAGPTAAAALAD
jgi:hypothetical protein